MFVCFSVAMGVLARGIELKFQPRTQRNAMQKKWTQGIGIATWRMAASAAK